LHLIDNPSASLVFRLIRTGLSANVQLEDALLCKPKGNYADIPEMDVSKLMTSLTEEEQKSPYAEYYSKKPADPDPDVMEAIQPGHAIDPGKATMPV
jgi:hypothetical protein